MRGIPFRNLTSNCTSRNGLFDRSLRCLAQGSLSENRARMYIWIYPSFSLFLHRAGFPAGSMINDANGIELRCAHAETMRLRDAMQRDAMQRERLKVAARDR